MFILLINISAGKDPKNWVRKQVFNEFLSKRVLKFGRTDSKETVYEEKEVANILNSKIYVQAHGMMKSNLEKTKLLI